MPSLRIINRVSKLFQPISVIPKNAEMKNKSITSKSQKLMLELGIIRQASPGSFHLLPLGVRAMQKLTRIVDQEMSKIDAQRVAFPTLTHTKLWKTTGRLEDTASELFTLSDRHDNKYILSPTHEESASDLLASLSPLSYKQFPLRLYQITSKFRDEIKPRFGLMRGRQFLMKDLYSFDVDVEAAKRTYDTVCDSYEKIFKRIGIEYLKVLGSTGNMGGSISHEYHYPANIGEDELLICRKCGHSANLELCGNSKSCSSCNSNDIEVKHGIEVGHTFFLGEKYSKPLNVTYLTNDRKAITVQMGSYGLGLSRILAASLEVLSLDTEMRWPLAIAPYSILIIPPKAGSKEEKALSTSAENLYHSLEEISGLKDEVILDDRTHLTIGKRMLEAKRVGYPYVVVLGAKTTEDPPLFEINALTSNSVEYWTKDQLLDYFRKQNYHLI